jgi:hypothetical protein
MRKLLAAFFLIFSAISPMAKENLPPGRYLPDGSYQPQNLSISDPLPRENSIESDVHHVPVNEILSVDWEPEVQLYFGDYGCFRTKIFKDSSGIIHTISNELHLNDISFYTRSLDGGSTWENGRLLLDSAQVPAMYDANFVGNSDTLSVIFSNTANTYTVFTTNHGIDWSSWNQHYTYWGGYIGFIERDNIVHLIVGDDDLSVTKYLSSSNHGISWSDAVTIFPDRWGRLTLGLNNSGLHLVVEGDDQEVYYSHKLNSDTSWTQRTRISGNPYIDSFFPSLVAWGDSNVIALWCDYEGSPYSWTGNIYYRRSTNSGLSWLPIYSLTENHLSLRHKCLAVGCSLFVALDQVVLEEDPDEEKLFLTYSTDNGESWSSLDRIMPSNSLSRDASLLISGDTIHMAFVDERYNRYNGALFYKRGYLRGEDAVHDNDKNLPSYISLSAYPNPFNSATTITLTGAEQAEIGIYDITGRLITTLHTIGGQALWDASAYSSGLYFARAAAEKASTIKLVLVK